MENTTTIEYETAFTAFETLLKSLCLNDFPCGLGNWRETHKCKKKKIEHIDTIESKFSVTLKDYGVKHEKVDNLQELTKIKQSPWKEDYSWSNEAEDLRKFAIHSPWMLNEKFIFEFFKSLKISDKNIREIDAKMLMLTNLEQLTLTANHIRTIESHHLPKRLEVLELYANEISSLADLCSAPPPLLHLGLGRNIISSIDDYITGGFWPNLLSLDMSFNDLSDLHDIIGQLQTLPKLRNLILQGNPISLIPGYRGYTIDCLRKLVYLDDRPITADEKHNFKGLSRRRESVLNEAIFDFNVSYISNIPVPEEVKEPENFPEYPKIIRNYFVQFTFLKQEYSGADILEVMEEDDNSTNKPSFRDSEVDDEQLTSRQESSMEHSVLAQSPIAIPSPIQENPEDDTAPIKSLKVPWTPGELTIDWKDTITRDDLLSLRNFLTKEMNVELIEEKILAYPPEMEDEIETGSMRSDSKKKDKNKPKSDKRDIKSKGKADKDKNAKNNKSAEKKKKKKKDNEQEFIHKPAGFTKVACWKLEIDDFLYGDALIEKTLFKPLDGSEATVVEKQKRPDSGGKPVKPQKGKKDNKMNKEREKEKDKKDKKDKSKSIVAVQEDEITVPPPIETQFSIKMHQWKTAQDSLQQPQQQQQQQHTVQTSVNNHEK